jgi:hypothetical protein
MRKILAILTALLMLVPCAALAHSGRTDSNGGHTDHSTGEYHYHHGYPAHDHYDIDGDGRKDCPYNFDDKTGYNSGSPSSSSSKNKPSSSASTSETTGKTNPTEQVESVAGIVVSVVLNALWIAPIASELMSTLIRDFKKKKKGKAPAPATEAAGEPKKTKMTRHAEFEGSSTISAAKYEDGALYITFTMGRKHAYFNVSEEIYDGLVSAEDKEKYYRKHIYKKYPVGIVHE